MAKEAKDDKSKGIKRSAKVSPDVPKSEAHAMKLRYGLLATKRSIEVEDIEKKARIRFIRMRPHFEHSISKSVDERLQDAARYAEGQTTTLSKQLGLLEIANGDQIKELQGRLKTIHEMVERTQANTKVMGGGGGGGSPDDEIMTRAKQVFELIDRDKSGDIDKSELMEGLKEMGLRIKEKEVKAIWRKYDIDGDQTIDKSEFVKLVRDTINFQNAHARALRVFSKHDVDGSGMLSRDELRRAAVELGYGSDGDDVNQIVNNVLRDYDFDDSTGIDLDEFTRLIGDMQAQHEIRSRQSKDVVARREDSGTSEHVSTVFYKYDKDRSRGLDRAELLKALSECRELQGNTFNSDDSLKIIGAFDDDGSKRMELNEFAELVEILRKHVSGKLDLFAWLRGRKASADDGSNSIAEIRRPTSGVTMVTDEYKVQSRPSWFDELPDWWERAENERKAASSRLETELSHQITTMQYQTQALARVTNHLAQEVARLRPEYWQRAHHATMSGPQSMNILEPYAHPTLRPKVQREAPTMHMGLPGVEGNFVDEGSILAKSSYGSSLGKLDKSNPIAQPFDHKKLQRAFDEFDTDFDGTLDAGELKRALAALGLPTTGAQAAKILHKYDADASGRLEFREFRTLAGELQQFKSGPNREDDVSRTFSHWDRDRSGKLEVGELEKALRELGLQTDTESAAKVLVKYDVDGSFGIELPEFRRMVADLRAFTGKHSEDDEVYRIFRLYDADDSGSIDAAELKNALNALGLSSDTGQTVDILRRYDADNSGHLELNEFRRLIGELRRFHAAGGRPRVMPTRVITSGTTIGSDAFWSSVPDIFRRFDTNRDGAIDSSELKDALSALGMAADSSQASQILNKYDMRGAGSLNLADFRALVTELRAFEVGDHASRRQLDRPREWGHHTYKEAAVTPVQDALNRAQSRGGWRVL